MDDYIVKLFLGITNGIVSETIVRFYFRSRLCKSVDQKIQKVLTAIRTFWK